MSKSFHFIYFCIIIVSFALGTLIEEKPEVVSLEALTPVNKNFGHNKRFLSAIDKSNSSSNSIECNKTYVPTINLVPTSTKLRKNQTLRLITENTEGLSHLFRQITNIELGNISEQTLDDKTIYLQIEEGLLTNQFNEHDKIDYIEEYLTDHRKNVSSQFITDLMEQATYMSSSDQIELLDIMRYQSLANRGANRDNFRNRITSGIISLSNSPDEAVRLSALIALSTAAENDNLAKNHIKGFLSDPSELVRAHALVAQYK